MTETMYGLNGRQWEFCRLYASGPGGVRGNAAAAYVLAGCRPRNMDVAAKNASRLLKNDEITLGLAHFHREADAKVMARLRDWKLLAPEAQQRVALISQGILPAATLNEYGYAVAALRPIETSNDVGIARMIYHSCSYIIERAYPARLYTTLEMQDPYEMLAMLMGCHPDQLDLD